MTTDLQARLLECICELHEGVEKGWRIAEPQHFERRFIEAADELARLTAMVERLEERVHYWKNIKAGLINDK